MILTNKCKGSFCEKSPLHLFFVFFIIKTGRCNAVICGDKTSFASGRSTIGRKDREMLKLFYHRIFWNVHVIRSNFVGINKEGRFAM